MIHAWFSACPRYLHLSRSHHKSRGLLYEIKSIRKSVLEARRTQQPTIGGAQTHLATAAVLRERGCFPLHLASCIRETHLRYPLFTPEEKASYTSQMQLQQRRRRSRNPSEDLHCCRLCLCTAPFASSGNATNTNRAYAKFPRFVLPHKLLRRPEKVGLNSKTVSLSRRYWWWDDMLEAGLCIMCYSAFQSFFFFFVSKNALFRSLSSSRLATDAFPGKGL